MYRIVLFALFLLSGCAGIQGSLFDLGVAAERGKSGLVEQAIEIEGQRIHYLERPAASSETETILLIHGFAANKDHWIRFVRFLPAHYRILALDLPGHGGNEPDSTASYTISYFTTTVSLFVKEVVNASVHLVGNSLGGRIATELSLAHPEQVATISLLDPAGIRSLVPSELDLALAQGENLLIPTTRDEYDRFTSIAFGDEPPNLPWPTASVVSRRYAERAPLYRKMWIDLFAEPDALETRLQDLSVPTLIIWGEKDGILDVSAAAEWADRIPHAVVEIMAGVGHAPMLEQPEETAELVIDFIKRNGY